MKKLGNKINDTFFNLPGYVQFIVSWLIILGLLVSLFWLNDNYLHLIDGGTEECSGTFEYNCGDIEDIEHRLDREPPVD